MLSYCYSIQFCLYESAGCIEFLTRIVTVLFYGFAYHLANSEVVVSNSYLENNLWSSANGGEIVRRLIIITAVVISTTRAGYLSGKTDG